MHDFELFQGELDPVHFDRHPVWSEYYDFDERDEIQSWGVSRNWLDAELARLPDHPHPLYSVLQLGPFPERMRMFIRAVFRTTVLGWKRVPVEGTFPRQLRGPIKQ